MMASRSSSGTPNDKAARNAWDTRNAPAFVQKRLEAFRKDVAKEKACRADKKCMATRETKKAAKKAEEQFFAEVVNPMCLADQDREAALAAMAHERANPSGYVRG